MTDGGITNLLYAAPPILKIIYSFPHRPDEVGLCESPALHSLVLCCQPCPDDGGVIAVQREVGTVSHKVKQRVIMHSAYGHSICQDGRLE